MSKAQFVAVSTFMAGMNLATAISCAMLGSAFGCGINFLLVESKRAGAQA